MEAVSRKAKDQAFESQFTKMKLRILCPSEADPWDLAPGLGLRPLPKGLAAFAPLCFFNRVQNDTNLDKLIGPGDWTTFCLLLKTGSICLRLYP